MERVAFGVFFTQSPSFLACQRMMQQRRGHNHAGSLFGVAAIPSDAQIRNLLDWPAPSEMSAAFWAVLERLAHRGVLAEAGYAVRSDTVRSDIVRSDIVRSDIVRSDIVRVEETGRVAYHNAWATNLGLSERTVRSIVAAGRARWKIEHENNSVLKNQGCHLEHNFGHDKQHVSTLLVQLMLLAFLTHTVLRLCDLAYQDLRAQLGSRQTFFNAIRALTRYIFFPSWDDLLHFMRTHVEPVSKPTPD